MDENSEGSNPLYIHNPVIKTNGTPKGMEKPLSLLSRGPILDKHGNQEEEAARDGDYSAFLQNRRIPLFQAKIVITREIPIRTTPGNQRIIGMVLFPVRIPIRIYQRSRLNKIRLLPR